MRLFNWHSAVRHHRLSRLTGLRLREDGRAWPRVVLLVLVTLRLLQVWLDWGPRLALN